MYELKNQMEELVRGLVDEHLTAGAGCVCEKCRLDVVALALNRLPSQYVITPRGALFARVDTTLPQRQIDALTVVLQAIQTVQTHPQHEPEYEREHEPEHNPASAPAPVTK